LRARNAPRFEDRSDDRIYLYSNHCVRQLVRLLITLLALLSLILPIILLYLIPDGAARLCIIIGFMLALASLLAMLTSATRYEIFAATAA
jgi:hypothetical protein